MLKHDEFLASLRGLVSGVSHPVTNLANASAALWQVLPDINWAGFYLMHRGMLWLGPFQGKPACTPIAVGRGVCGTAAQRDETIVVPDVQEFPGHIACDSASRSEIVVPLRAFGRVIGVLDIDSPFLNRFSEDDRALLEAAVEIVTSACDWNDCGYDLQL